MKVQTKIKNVEDLKVVTRNRRVVTPHPGFTMVHLFTNKVFSNTPQEVIEEDDNDWFKSQIRTGRLLYVTE